MPIARDPNVLGQEFYDAIVPLSASATGTAGLFTAPRAFRIDSVEVFSDTTIASSGANYFTFNLRVGGRSCGTFTINGNAITAGTSAVFTPLAETGQAPISNRVAAKGELVDCVLTLTGALTINVRLVVHGRYVG
ncbi:MAG: hypothetical protein H0X39_00945 [Actinobacteria bacterium]|nr:hypothetical protein [Actinomycetota bacterium]